MTRYKETLLSHTDEWLGAKGFNLEAADFESAERSRPDLQRDFAG